MTETYNDDRTSEEATMDISSECPADRINEQHPPADGATGAVSQLEGTVGHTVFHPGSGSSHRSASDGRSRPLAGGDRDRSAHHRQPRSARAQRRSVQNRSTPDGYTSLPMTGQAYDNGSARGVTDSDIPGSPDAELAGAHAGRLHDESQPWRLFDALLHGRLLDQFGLWEVADYLRLPTKGPFIVIAGEVPEPGGEALPGIESKLRSLDVCSAWRLCPEVQVGIVHLRTDNHQDKVLALVSRMATTRVAISSRFDDLRDTCHALRYARMTLHGRPQPGGLVSVFDDSILAGAAVSAPEVMTKLVAPMLERFEELPDDERDILFQTFRVWAETGGSPRTTGELLFCHPNTVRHRLRRIEQRTGRSLSQPRDVAELCLAFEVHRRLL